MNWITVTESQYPWERDALAFVRRQFPDHEPSRAWANFEFIADDGSINEVDLLVCTPHGFFLIEIKSHEGRVFGDAGTWTWEKDGRLATTDNPVILANTKAKKLRSLLQRQKTCKKNGWLPFLEVLVFCSAPDLRCELQGTARYHVCLRDREKEGDQLSRPGIMAAIKRRECPGLDPQPKGLCDRPTVKMISQAMEQAGIRPSQQHRRVSDYVLDHLIEEGPGYQDWQATHARLPDVKRRVRIYTVQTGASDAERQTIERAAQREAQLLEALQHQAILRREGFTEHELGPALIFEHDPLPDRPALDDLLHAVGFDFAWDTTAKQGIGGYVSRLSETLDITSGSDSMSRFSTAAAPSAAGEITPEIADARQFEERLQRAIKDGSFLVLLVHPRHYQRACNELCGRFTIKLVDFEALFIKTLYEVAEQARVNWGLVLKTDARPHQGDWHKLMLLVGRAMPLVEQELLSTDTTMLVVYPGLLARYDRMDLLERLRDKVGRRAGIPGLWLLLPGQNQAMMDGKAVPIISPGQRVNIPESWLQNVHRGEKGSHEADPSGI